MKRAQMRADSQNILAVVVEVWGSLVWTEYTVFYTSGCKRTFINPSPAFRSRFDFWYRIRDLRGEGSVSHRLLVPRLSSSVPDSVFTYFPVFKKGS